MIRVRRTMIVLGAASALCVQAASVNAGGTTYWSQKEATAALRASHWFAAHERSLSFCEGAGAHIHSLNGIPLYRYFRCTLISGITGKSANVRVSVVWVAAGAPLVVIPRQPGDLWDNPLAPLPPPGFRTQYLNADQAESRFVRSAFAREQQVGSKDWTWANGCAGRGFHYHLVGQTVYRTFYCSALGLPNKTVERGKKAHLIAMRNLTAWLSVSRDGTITIARTAPSGLWQP
jgi:hypothetical protein